MTEVASVVTLPAKPVLIFDGDCNFCRRWILRWQQATGERVEYIPLQDPTVAQRFPELTRERCEQAVQFIDTDGHIYSAAEAVFRAMAVAPCKRWPLWCYQQMPGVAPITEGMYRFVAKHRTGFSFLTRLFWGEQIEPPTHLLTRWLFLRLLGIIYFIAFVSLWTQIDGLVGSHGILPAQAFMESAHNWANTHSGWDAFRMAPTLCWFSASDAFLHFLCWGGALAAVLATIGIAPAPMLALAWLFYLSLTTVCGEFLGYQWDTLLLETGLLAVFFAPLQFRPGLARTAPPSQVMLWLLRWLLFRLIFAAGVVKLASHDVNWRGLTALFYHYQTQPLPTWTSWYAQQLPLWFQQFCCGILFVIELGAPCLIVMSRGLRFLAAGAITFLMLLIAATGNYCFFNLLAIALCVLLLDDAVLRRWAPRRWRKLSANFRAPRWPWWVTMPLAALVIPVTMMTLLEAFRERIPWPTPMIKLYDTLVPSRSFNPYGLFAVMTTVRPEIIIEGSNDGDHWLPYEFKYKPGDPLRPPSFVAPHQPRLDWQLWFEALRVEIPRPSPTVPFVNLCVRLLQGQPEVLALLQTNPFPTAPPRFLRAWAYEYRFTDFAERRQTGAWWRRRFLGEYCPVMMLRKNVAGDATDRTAALPSRNGSN
jgi:predicted DCC family thiol-disulfide oxidoreductase YuxK